MMVARSCLSPTMKRSPDTRGASSGWKVVASSAMRALANRKSHSPRRRYENWSPDPKQHADDAPLQTTNVVHDAGQSHRYCRIDRCNFSWPISSEEDSRDGEPRVQRLNNCYSRWRRSDDGWAAPCGDTTDSR